MYEKATGMTTNSGKSGRIAVKGVPPGVYPYSGMGISGEAPHSRSNW
jgi:hypothetical protein